MVESNRQSIGNYSRSAHDRRHARNRRARELRSKLSPELDLPQGAQEASGIDEIVRAAREQMGKGADWVKLYADYRWGKDEPSRPTFSQEEMAAAVQAAHSAGRPVAAHAISAEGMRRAVMAGVDTIEHGDDGTLEVFKLMKSKGVAFCPTVAAGDAVSQYRGWHKGTDPETGSHQEKTREHEGCA